MTEQEAIDRIKEYNEWRRGAKTDMQEPYLIGLAIDEILNSLQKKDLIIQAQEELIKHLMLFLNLNSDIEGGLFKVQRKELQQKIEEAKK